MAGEGVMSEDRKYRQRGYQDDSRDRERPRQAPSAPRAPREAPVGPKTPNLMASHTVFRCTRCGNMLDPNVTADARCSRCGVDVHSCIQCVSFDPGAPLECSERIPARVSPKDVKNTCTFFSPRTTVERQTSTGPASVSSARQAFDDLFK
jgi:hypothetical protein